LVPLLSSRADTNAPIIDEIRNLQLIGAAPYTASKADALSI